MAQTLQRTPLHDRHVALGARMVPFAGWEMPVQYAGVIPEHRAVRRDCGVFDVSHMGEIEIEGPRAAKLLQSTLSNDLDRIQAGQAQYTLLTNETGGVVDDLIVYKLDEFRFLLVVNAANRAVDYRWFRDREIPGSDVRDVSDEYALLAVQGPRAFEHLGLPDAKAFTFAEGEIDGIVSFGKDTKGKRKVVVTPEVGEAREYLIPKGKHISVHAGCELLVMAEDAGELWDRVLERGAQPCGLGARDTLRLEACFPLHGQDITPETDAISAGLAWCCALDKEFTGADPLREIKERGPDRKLAPFVMEERAIPRAGMAINGGGEVTSGTHSPMLDRGVGMGYVPAPDAKPGTELTIDVRGRPRRARVVKKPIYPSHDKKPIYPSHETA